MDGNSFDFEQAVNLARCKTVPYKGCGMRSITTRKLVRRLTSALGAHLLRLFGFFIIASVFSLTVASSEQILNFKVEKTTQRHGRQDFPCLKAAFELSSPLKTERTVSFDIQFDYMGHWAPVEIGLLDAQERKSIVLTFLHYDAPPQVFVNVLHEEGWIWSPGVEFFSPVPAEKHQYRIHLLKEKTFISVHKGKELLWCSEELDLRARRFGKVFVEVLDMRKSRGQEGWIKYNEEANNIEFRSENDSSNNFYVLGAIENIQVAKADKSSLPRKPPSAAEPKEQVELFSVNKVYPPASFSPVKTPCLIGGYQTPMPGIIPYENILLAPITPLEDIDKVWFQKGILPLIWAFGNQQDFGGVEEWVKYYLQFPERLGAHAILLDEWFGGQEHKEKGMKMLKAIHQLKQSYPHFFIAVAYTAADPELAEAARRGDIDLMVIEGYTYGMGVPGWACGEGETIRRIRVMRQQGLIKKTIVLFGHVVPKSDEHPDGMTPERVERMIRLIRREGKEMPGIGFYCTHPHVVKNILSKVASEDKFHHLWKVCGELAHKYYIAPAPKIKIISPKQGAKVSGIVRIIAKATAKGRRIVCYRFFIDNRCVAVSDSPIYQWDTSASQTGKHIITVHAVDRDFLQGSAQIEVEVLR